MKSLEIVGYKRANLGKKASKDLRAEAQVPCVLYGGTDHVHFHAPMILFRDLLYTPDAYQVTLNIEGSLYTAILQEAQFHPVNEMILHVDFLEIIEGKAITIEVPIKFEGNSPGVQKGGKLLQKLRKIKLRGQASDIPDYILIDITDLDLGKSVKVNELKAGKFAILNNPSLPVATVEIPRSLRGKVEA
ncbi:MAG: 50S ribosomal protein L25/general stress protein Ctc [Cytophagaceae bacterium]|nr:50S ribosomal protein L25/general stress protein Ctc [Cytophagaceae bacterium]